MKPKFKFRLIGKTWEFVSPITAPKMVIALAAGQIVPKLAEKADALPAEKRDNGIAAVEFLRLWSVLERSLADAEAQGIGRAEFMDSMKQIGDGDFLNFLDLAKHYTIKQVEA